MGKNVLVISTSPRKNSNSEALATAFAEGALSAGNTVEQISLRGKTINFCIGCLTCVKTQRCVIKDDTEAIRGKTLNADVIAFATPIYYYEMSGQMKTLLDRSNPLYKSDYAFRDIYLLSSAAEDDPETPKRAETGLGGWIDCYEKARLAGSVFMGGVDEPGASAGHPALEEAYAMGRSV